MAASHDENGLARERAQPRVIGILQRRKSCGQRARGTHGGPRPPSGSRSSPGRASLTSTTFSTLSVPRVLRIAELGLAALEVKNVCRGILASRKRREAEQISAEAAPVS